MSGHAWRPVLVIIVLVALLILVRQLYVPGDFGVHAGGYSYGWYRARSTVDWQYKTIKYQGRETCRPCHAKQVNTITGMPHAIIQCENCHGPAGDHPTSPARLTIDRSRALCLRCHAKLAYPSSARGGLRGIDPASHNPGRPCVSCHNPHHPILTGLQTSSAPHSSQYCRSCHQQVVDTIEGQPHEIVYCEDCHGPAGNHPTDPVKLKIDKNRSLCIGCHVDKWRHNVGRACIVCHDPHRSSLQFLQFLP